jgi:arylsulfatase A-like enzyme
MLIAAQPVRYSGLAAFDRYRALRPNTPGLIDPNVRSNPSLRSLLVVPAWFGLMGGLVEAAGLAIRASRPGILELSRDFGWMTPLGLVVAAVGAGLGFSLLRSAWRGEAAAIAAIFGASLAVALDLLLYLPKLHDAAILVLALGVAYQVTRWARPRRGPLEAMAGRTLPWLAGLVLIVGAGPRIWRAVRERQALGALQPAPANAPNVLLVSLDAVRARNSSVYGYSRRTLPRLEELAAKGVVFDAALSTASWTLPSHASMLTGRWHHQLSVGYNRPLDRAYPTVAEYLSGKGWASAGVVANLRYCGHQTGLDRGFIHYHDYPVSLGQFLSSSMLWRKALGNFRLRRLIANDQHLSRKSAAEVNRAALDWVDRIGQRPFFLFLNYFDAHEPYLPPPPFDRQFGPGRRNGKLSPLHRWLWEPAVRHGNMGPAQLEEEVAAYDGALAYLDQELAALLSALESRGRLANTLVIVTADHGEEFQEHRVFEHGYSLYRPGVQVPLIIVKPGTVPAGVRIAEPVSLRDLPASITDLLGVGAGAPFAGQSVARYWSADSAARSERPILSQVDRVTGHPDWFPVSKGDLYSVTYRGLRYIKTTGGGEELFEFAGDPWERQDLASVAEYQPALAGFRALLDSLVPARGSR